ncbi:MAG: class GN sortase [Parvibaculum sp.]
MRPAHWLTLIAALVSLSWGGALLGQAAYMNGKAALAQVLLTDAWDTTKETGKPTKAWDWADTWPVAKLTFTRLDTDVIVLAGVSGEALAFGPGHISSTATPGAKGLSVIAAHRDTHFSVLRHARIGDNIIVETSGGETHIYQIEEARIVDANASGLYPTNGNRTLALVTCFPFDETERGSLRYVMLARSKPEPTDSRALTAADTEI